MNTLSPPRFLLEPAAYVSDAWLELERERLFGRTWQLVAAVEDLPAGDPDAAVDATVGTTPLVIRRGADGAVVARRDDGTPASVGVWEGLIFAHPDPAAPPLSAFMGSWVDLVGSYRPGALTEVARVAIEGEFNWKLFVENHIDVLHLWYLHDRTLADFDHPRFEHHNVGGHWASYEPLKQGADGLGTATLTQGTTPIAHIDDRDRFGIGAHMLFPNVLMASSSEFWITYAVSPLGPTRSVIDLRIRAEPGADGDRLVAAARSFIDEDVFACEQVQRVLRSPRFEVGPLAFDHERPIMTFHQHLLDALGVPA